MDFIGVGLVYPLFTSMLFDYTDPILPTTTTPQVRGMWLGILIAMMPLTQFFSSPIWGALSDSQGRKKPLLYSLCFTILGYITSFIAIVLSNIFILLASRLILGFASGNMSIVQATISDLSSKKEKAKNFGLYSMALGSGFTLGPFFGGILSAYGYAAPFLFTFVLALMNWGFAALFFKETNHHPVAKKVTWSSGISQLKIAYHLKGARTILAASFLHNFGWSFFFEFIPIYLIATFALNSQHLGIFYGVAGALYALSSGLLIRPFVSRFKPETLFFFGILMTALTLFTIPLIHQILWIFPLLFFLCFFVSFVTPNSTAAISDAAGEKLQGEALGVLSSTNAAALVLSPLFSGAFVGTYPEMPIWGGGGIMIVAALLVLCIFRAKLFRT